jgi:hypothetical protein
MKREQIHERAFDILDGDKGPELNAEYGRVSEFEEHIGTQEARDDARILGFVERLLPVKAVERRYSSALYSLNYYSKCACEKNSIEGVDGARKEIELPGIAMLEPRARARVNPLSL